MKRELGVSASSVEVDGPRAKRRRNVSGDSGTIEDVAMADGAASSEQDIKGNGDVNVDEVREEGLKVWQVLKNAVNKECVTLYREPLSSC